MGTSESGPGDQITASTLNVTKFGSLGVFIVTLAGGIADALGISFNGKTIDFSPGQWLLMIGGATTLVVLLVIADVLARAYTTAHSNAEPVWIVEPRSAKIYNESDHSTGHKDGEVDAFAFVNGKPKVLVTDPDGAKWVDWDLVEQ